jgi:hypothetical protein
MRVLHLKRTFLLRTETFIYSQLTHLPSEKAEVLARDIQNLERFPGLNLHAISFVPETMGKLWSEINYRLIRRMTNYERQFYLREIVR